MGLMTNYEKLPKSSPVSITTVLLTILMGLMSIHHKIAGMGRKATRKSRVEIKDVESQAEFGGLEVGRKAEECPCRS